MRSRQNRKLAVGAVAALFFVGGCGGDDAGGDKGAGGGDAAPASAEVLIAGFRYDPSPVRVRAGGKVTWRNADEAPHTATAEDGQGADFDTGRLALGETGEVTLEQPGTYTYYCTFHRFMTSTVEVVE